MKLSNKDIQQLIGFITLILVVILFMVFVNGKHNIQVEKLDWLKNLFGMGDDDDNSSSSSSSVTVSTSSSNNSTSTGRNSTSTGRNSTISTAAVTD